jgi:hypothetical protein
MLFPDTNQALTAELMLFQLPANGFAPKICQTQLRQHGIYFPNTRNHLPPRTGRSLPRAR